MLAVQNSTNGSYGLISILASRRVGSTGESNAHDHVDFVLDEPTRRGKSGGQVRDEYRDEYDPGRGGYGRAIAEERQKEEEEYGRGR